MIVGGLIGSSPSDDVEIIELPNNKEQPCQKPADNPYHNYGMVGGFVNGRPLICGGWEIAFCSEYVFVANRWDKTPFAMNIDRVFGTSVVLPNGTFLVLGGRHCPTRGDCHNSFQTLETTEALIDDSHFEYTFDQPEGISHHCAVAINDTHIILMGGILQDQPKDEAYLFNIRNHSWAEIGRMNTVRFGHGCGLVGENKVIVASGGGIVMTEILHLDTMTWVIGEL